MYKIIFAKKPGFTNMYYGNRRRHMKFRIRLAGAGMIRNSDSADTLSKTY